MAICPATTVRNSASSALKAFSSRRPSPKTPSARPRLTSGMLQRDFDPEEYAIIAGEGLKSLCSIPLVNRGRALGVLGLGRRDENAFSADDAEFLTVVAGQIAIAVENAFSYREISELKDKLAQEKLYLEEEIRSEMAFEHIIGTSSPLKHVLELVETVP